MKVGVPKEIVADERRVALVPEAVGRLVKVGLEVLVETGAGERAFFGDQAYEEAGARIEKDAASLLAEAEVVLKVREPQPNEIELTSHGAVLIGFLPPWGNLTLVQRLAERRITSFSMNLIPRITRAQPMDALSSQSTVAGYKAVLIAANTIGKFFPMLSTAAGTVAPAKVFILGAGVAGLQAIATARRLGAIVQAFDVRPAVKEQVESLGAQFVGLAIEEAEEKTGYAKELSEEHQRKERELISKYVKEADIVISTALVPGKRAPLLITREMVQQMRPGSVIIDLAAEQGGNCELTRSDHKIIQNGVTILGPTNLPSSMPTHASQMYSKNISTFLLGLIREKKLYLDFEDPIVKESCVTHDGKIMHEPTRVLLEREGMR